MTAIPEDQESVIIHEDSIKIEEKEEFIPKSTQNLDSVVNMTKVRIFLFIAFSMEFAIMGVTLNYFITRVDTETAYKWVFFIFLYFCYIMTVVYRLAAKNYKRKFESTILAFILGIILFALTFSFKSDGFWCLAAISILPFAFHAVVFAIYRRKANEMEKKEGR